MRIRGRQQKAQRDDNLVPLINIVFLILIFFLVASTIRPFADREVRLARSQATASAGALHRTIVIHDDGSVHVDAVAMGVAELGDRFLEWAADPTRKVTIIADRETNARAAVEIVSLASAAGLADVRILTQRAR